MMSWDAMTNNLAPMFLLLLQCMSPYVGIMLIFWIATWAYCKIRYALGLDCDAGANERSHRGDDEGRRRVKQVGVNGYRDAYERPTEWDDLRERLRGGR
jgi:hypothetical protein